ncbi:MAG: MaoC family dehydratase [Beijerinckiaceae bacterium]
MPAPGERLPEQRVGPFDAAAVAAYARASGDDNPIHTEPTVARAAGFDAPPVHGMRLMAAIEPALAAWRPDLRLSRLSGTFAVPLLVGEAATFSGRVLKSDDASAFLRVTIQGPRRGPCLVAEAQVAPRGAGAP